MAAGSRRGREQRGREAVRDGPARPRRLAEGRVKVDGGHASSGSCCSRQPWRTRRGEEERRKNEKKKRKKEKKKERKVKKRK